MYFCGIKITAKILLQCTPEQADALRETLELGNRICNHISQKAWEHKVFTPFKLHKIVYHDVKSSFPVTAQLIIRLIAKVADAYTLGKEKQRTFRKYGAISYDSRILRYYTEKRFVSIWTAKGRMRIPFIVNDHNAELLKTQQGESDLVYRDGKFFLFATCNVEEPPEEEFKDILGVDLGIANIATDSDGQSFSGERLEASRQWYAERRATLQSVGTKSAKRRLKQLSGRQKRFQQNENHLISKTLVQKAKGTKRALALEDLTGIRKRTTEKVRHEQRAQHSNWAFYQLKQFVAYKAKRLGVPIITIDPRNTSRTCNACGYCDKANRKSQSLFVCGSCGHSENADKNAAKNIRSKGFLRKPMVADGAYATVILQQQATRL